MKLIDANDISAAPKNEEKKLVKVRKNLIIINLLED